MKKHYIAPYARGSSPSPKIPLSRILIFFNVHLSSKIRFDHINIDDLFISTQIVPHICAIHRFTRNFLRTQVKDFANPLLSKARGFELEASNISPNHCATAKGILLVSFLIYIIYNNYLIPT